MPVIHGKVHSTSCDTLPPAKARGREIVSCHPKNVRKDCTPYKLERQHSKSKSFAKFVETIAAIKGDTDTALQRVAATFPLHTVVGDDSPEADHTAIRLWLATVIAKGCTKGTAVRYLGKLRSLYLEYRGESPETDAPFRELRDALRDPEMWQRHNHREALTAIRRVATRRQSLADADLLTARILLYLLSLGGAPFSAAINASLADPSTGIDHADAIVEAQRPLRNGCKYLFPLGQRKKRDPQIAGEIAKGIARLLGLMGYRPQEPITSETITAWWVEAAIAAGLSLPEIRSALPEIPSSHKWLTLLPAPAVKAPLLLSQSESPKPVSDAARRLTVLQRVAAFINPTLPRWHALCLRSRVTFNDLAKLLKDTDEDLYRSVQFYYPTYTRWTLKEKKKVKEEVPYIRHIVFARMTADKALPLMHAIGEHAWCYKTANTPDAPYAVIPAASMLHFQRFIGVLDDASRREIAALTGAEAHDALRRGARVRITGGIFAGCEAEILAQTPADGKDTHSYTVHQDSQSESKTHASPQGDSPIRTFLLRITNDLTLSWTAPIPEIYLQPL